MLKDWFDEIFCAWKWIFPFSTLCIQCCQIKWYVKANQYHLHQYSFDLDFLTFTQSDIVMVRYNEEAIRCIAESDILSSYVRMHVREMCLKNASVEMCSLLYYFCRSERNLIFKGILKHMNTSQMSNGFAQIPSGFSNMSIIY